MIFIIDYLNLNQQLVIKPYPICKIVYAIHHLEVFQYVIELDLNMGYYTIGVFSISQDMTTIVNEFGKSGYNRLFIRICASGYLFEDKVDELPSYINVFKTYNYDTLVQIKDTL